MSNSIASLRRKIAGAEDLQSVVHTMKTVAASSVSQYERSVAALTEYYRTVELGLVACLGQRQRKAPAAAWPPPRNIDPLSATVHAVVLGSDQGLVGQFNETVVDFATQTLSGMAGEQVVWAVGERAYRRFEDTGRVPAGRFPVPNSIKAITPLVGEILTENAAVAEHQDVATLMLFYNRPIRGSSYEPTCQRVLPLDDAWLKQLSGQPWPTKQLPGTVGNSDATLRALVQEYLFVSLFRACAESLSSENNSRLAAMQRADTNISELLEELQGTFHRLRQSTIDEELFDLISGYEALGASPSGLEPDSA